MPQRRQPAEQEAYDPYGQQQAPQQGAYPSQQGQHAPYGQQSGQQSGQWGQQQPQGYQDHQQAYQPQQSYGQQPQPYGQQQPYGQSPYGQQGAYSDPYNGYGSQQGYQQPQQHQPMIPAPHPFTAPQSYGSPEPDQSRGYPQPSSYDRYQGQQPYAPPAQQPAWPQQQPAHDQRGYDLGHYAPQGAPQAEQPFQLGPADHFANPDDHYQQGEHDYADGEADHDGEQEEDAPRGGKRMMMIAAALVGAIGIGGAMAYTYKTVFAGPRSGGVKTADLKAKPANETSIAERRTDVPPAAQEDNQDGGSDSPKKVRIIQIPPGGQPTETASATPSPPPTPLPGIMLDMGPRPGQMPGAPMRPPMAQQPGTPPPSAMAPTRPAAAPPVRTVAVTPPPAPTQPEAAPTPPAAKKERAKAEKPEKVEKAAVPKVKDDQSSITTASTLGYVAVLASHKTRVDALKAFADAQQKHPDVLGAKTPDVLEANLGDKGMWYRAVVGPPGSREGAANLCGALKGAGYNGCWVSAY